MAVVTTFLPSDTATQKRYRYYVCDTEAELPGSPDEGDLAYAKDTDEMFYRTTSAWRQVSGQAATFTPGSVIFAGASGVLTEDNANLFFDDTNNRLGIGTSSPGSKLSVDSGASSLMARFNAAAQGDVLYNRSDTPAGTQTLNRWQFGGKDGAGTSVFYGTLFVQEDVITAGAHGGGFIFEVAKAGGLSQSLKVFHSATISNDQGDDIDFRVEGDNDANMIFVDASVDRIGFKTGAPANAFHVATSDVRLDITVTAAGGAFPATLGLTGNAGTPTVAAQNAWGTYIHGGTTYYVPLWI